jgi:hypothetical protein
METVIKAKIIIVRLIKLILMEYLAIAAAPIPNERKNRIMLIIPWMLYL